MVQAVRPCGPAGDQVSGGCLSKGPAPVKIAVFTDNDFAKVNGVTTVLSAVLQYAPPHVHPRIYTHSNSAADFPDYFAVRARGISIPFYRDRIDPARISVCVHGVDPEKFSPAHRSQQLRKGWGLASGDLALLYAGRLSREKGLAVIPDIDARLRRAGVSHRWIFVGDGPYRRQLERGLERAIFMGTLSHRDVAVPMASADLFVFPSCTDTAGNVVLEAQACGLPVIVSDQGGPPENTTPDVSGRVCRGGQSADFASAIIDLARDRQRRRAMSSAARAYGLHRRWEDALAPLYGAYREVAARAHGTDGAATTQAVTAHRS